jgi:hypothetical protein
MTPPSDLIEKAVRSALEDLQSFAKTVPFRRLLAEMSGLPPIQRHDFVQRVILCDAELNARGVVPPPGITLQRSAFSDERPTLFCMTKHLGEGVIWEKVTLTFDNLAGEPAVRFADMAPVLPRGN